MQQGFHGSRNGHDGGTGLSIETDHPLMAHLSFGPATKKAHGEAGARAGGHAAMKGGTEPRKRPTTIPLDI